MGNPRWTTPKTVRQSRSKKIMGDNMNLRDKILAQMENIKPSIEELETKKKALEQDDRYAEDYKKEMISKINNSIKEIENELLTFITEAAAKETKTKKETNTNTETQTSNILAMLDITKDTITEDQLQEKLNENLNDPLVVSAIYSIAETKNLYIEKPIDKEKYLEDNINKLKSTIAVDGLDSLGVGLALHYLD